MSDRSVARWFTVGSWTWTFLILVWAVVVYFSGTLPEDDPFVSWLNFLAPFFSALASIIVTRSPGNSIAWLLGTVEPADSQRVLGRACRAIVERREETVTALA